MVFAPVGLIVGLGLLFAIITGNTQPPKPQNGDGRTQQVERLHPTPADVMLKYNR